MPVGADTSREEITALLIERARAGLGLSLLSISLFAIADPFVFPQLLRPLYALKAVQIGTTVAALFVLRRGMSLARAVVVGLVALTVLCVTTAASGIVTHDAGTTPVLLVVVTMGAATLLPWGVGPQIVLQIVASASVVWNMWVVRGATGLTSLPVAIAVGSVAAVYAAYASQRYLVERRRAELAETELRARYHQAELAHAARLSTLGGMAAGLAHEINQPLAAIVSYARGCARRLESGDARPADLLPVIDEISGQALRAGEVLRRIQEFVRHTQLPRSSVDLNGLVRDALRFAEVEARQQGIGLRLDLSTTALTVEVDPIQIEQVILNLVRNGFEAMPADGTTRRQLTIATGRTPDGDVEVAVSDTGIGVPATIAGRVFDPFFTTRADGLGLGLSISRSIVESHGGRLWTTPNPPRGACFRFTLPAASGGEGASHAA